MAKGITRRSLVAGAALVPFLQPVRMAFAQGYASGAPVPPIVMESYPDPTTVEVVRLYARELQKLGIRVDHKPLNFGQILGKVYGSKDLDTAVMGLGFPEDRFDPDFYLRTSYATDGAFNISHYSNPEFDALAQKQLNATDRDERREAIFEAQRILARDLPSWPICSRHAINPVNTALFTNVKPSRGFGLECYHVAPYLEIEPVGDVREVAVASTYRLSSGNPFTERAANGRGFLRFIYDTFLRYDGDLNLIPWAAEKVDMVDATTYDLVLREGMTWHDGQPVTIEDAKFTFDYLLQWRPPLWQAFITAIEGAEITGERTLRVTLKAPAATFTTVSLAQITILPKHVWEKVEGSPMDWDAPREGGLIGSGPFQYASFERDVDFHVTAFKEHWTGGPKIDGLHYIQAASVEQMIGGMEAGTIHIIGDGITVVEGERLAGNPGIELMVTPMGTVISFWMDVTKAPFDNLAFRQALYHATPKQAIIDIALGGTSDPARRSPLPPLMDEWIPDDLPGDEYDIDRARAYLEEAGFRLQGDRLIAP